MSSGHKALAAAVVRTAAEDMESAYKKMRQWDESGKSGMLMEYVRGKLNRRALSALSLSHSEITAIEFLKEDSEIRDLYFSIIDLGGLPKKITEQRDFINENRDRLEREISYYRRQITKSGQTPDSEPLESQKEVMYD